MFGWFKKEEKFSQEDMQAAFEMGQQKALEEVEATMDLDAYQGTTIGFTADLGGEA